MYQPVYVEVSNDICVEVRPVYLQEKSSAVARKHVFAYFISIRNMGEQSIQLLGRHWEIKDPGKKNYEINGEGVVGKKPVIGPNDKYTYNSFCVLKSYRGSMKGYYQMQRGDDVMIKVSIPEFLLTAHTLN